MSGCDAELKDVLAEVAAGRADRDVEARVRGHAAECDDCAEELRLLGALARGRPELPAELAARIDRGVREGLRGPGARRRWIPSWGLAAAAVAVLALGTPSLVERIERGDAPVGGEGGSDDEVAGVWVSEEPLVAGAPVLDGLTDEQLSALLEDLGG